MIGRAQKSRDSTAMLPYTAAAQADVKRRSCTCSFPSLCRAEQQSLRSDSELDGLGSQPGGGPNSVPVPRIRIRQAVQTPRIEHLHEAGEEMRACLIFAAGGDTELWGQYPSRGCVTSYVA
jgi:hypothetical protein